MTIKKINKALESAVAQLSIIDFKRLPDLQDLGDYDNQDTLQEDLDDLVTKLIGIQEIAAANN